MACSLDYTLQRNRLRSFHEHWKTSFPVKPEELSEAGLYYTGPEDWVKCEFCKVSIGNWKHDDVALTKHTRMRPVCPFVIQVQLSLESQQIEQINMELLEKGIREDLNWQRLVRNSDAVKIVEDMGFSYDVILRAVDKICETVGSSEYLFFMHFTIVFYLYEIYCKNVLPIYLIK